MFYPRQVRLGRTTALPGRLRLIPTDLDVDPIELGAGEAVEVTGTAEELLLLLWQRHRVDDDRATALLAHPITP
ncbi:unannotated protein [freshwater metagenome]|uniref:Unannotated protein n=1 Tax=freshwater metagenome TaxID=449393 RepID=A0A6J6Q4V1_9ZZZZ